MNFKELQEESKIWNKHNFPNNESYMPLLGVVEEVGELSHSHLKKVQSIRNNENHDNNIKDAIGDIVIYLAGYCTLQNLDLNKIIEDTWELVKKRDWIKYPLNGMSK